MALSEEERALFGAFIREGRKMVGIRSQHRLARLIEERTGIEMTGAAIGAWERGESVPRDRRVIGAVDEILNLNGMAFSLLGYAPDEGMSSIVRREELDALAERVQHLEAALDIRNKAAKPGRSRGGLRLAASSGDAEDAKKISKAPQRKRPSPTERGEP